MIRVIDLANSDNYPRTSRVKIKYWKCIRTAVELGWNSIFSTLVCWILKGYCQKHKQVLYICIFAWSGTKKKSGLRSSDSKLCLIAIFECLVLLFCSVSLYFSTAMPQCIFSNLPVYSWTDCMYQCFVLFSDDEKEMLWYEKQVSRQYHRKHQGWCPTFTSNLFTGSVQLLQWSECICVDYMIYGFRKKW